MTEKELSAGTENCPPEEDGLPSQKDDFPPNLLPALVGGTLIWLIICGVLYTFPVLRYLAFWGFIVLAVLSVVCGFVWWAGKYVVRFLNNYDDDTEEDSARR